MWVGDRFFFLTQSEGRRLAEGSSRPSVDSASAEDLGLCHGPKLDTRMGSEPEKN